MFRLPTVRHPWYCTANIMTNYVQFCSVQLHWVSYVCALMSSTDRSCTHTIYVHKSKWVSYIVAHCVWPPRTRLMYDIYIYIYIYIFFLLTWLLLSPQKTKSTENHDQCHWLTLPLEVAALTNRHFIHSNLIRGRFVVHGMSNNPVTVYTRVILHMKYIPVFNCMSSSSSSSSSWFSSSSSSLSPNLTSS